MPVEHAIDTEKRLITTIWHGEATDGEFIRALTNYLQEIKSKPEYLRYNELVDFRYLTEIKLTANGIWQLGKIASSQGDKQAVTKLAFVVSSGLAYGLVRMYGIYRDLESRSGKEIQVFKNESDALEWLNTNT